MDEFVDAQVNFGKSIFGPNCDPATYDQRASEIGITRAIVMPTLTHELTTSEHTERSCIWENVGGIVTFYREVHSQGEWSRELCTANPYVYMNRWVLSQIRELNRNSTIKYYFIPKVHPHLDSKEVINSLAQEPEVVGLKINGLASHCIPQQTPPLIAGISRDHKLPLFIHTDHLNPNYQDERIPSYLRHLIADNNPNASIDWHEQHKPYRTHLAHLARLDRRAANRINQSTNLSVNLGPDYQLQDEPIRLAESTDNILHAALELFIPDKLMYSTDYAWNVFDRRDWKKSDWETHGRLRQEAEKLSFSEKKKYNR